MHIAQTLKNLRNRYSQENPQALRNPWVLAWIAIVVLFVTVNGIFFIVAVVTSPGLVVQDYYEQGRQYEKNALKLMAQHNALKWETRFDTPSEILVATPDIFRFSAVDKRGLPLDDATVELQAYRPADADADFSTPMFAIGPGLYEGKISFPLPGIWDLNVNIKYNNDQLSVTRRINALVP